MAAAVRESEFAPVVGPICGSSARAEHGDRGDCLFDVHPSDATTKVTSDQRDSVCDMEDGDIAVGDEVHEIVGDGTVLFCRRVKDDVYQIEESTEIAGPRLLVEGLGGYAAFHVGRRFEKELARRRFEIKFR